MEEEEILFLLIHPINFGMEIKGRWNESKTYNLYTQTDNE